MSTRDFYKELQTAATLAVEQSYLATHLLKDASGSMLLAAVNATADSNTAQAGHHSPFGVLVSTKFVKGQPLKRSGYHFSVITPATKDAVINTYRRATMYEVLDAAIRLGVINAEQAAWWRNRWQENYDKQNSGGFFSGFVGTFTGVLPPALKKPLDKIVNVADKVQTAVTAPIASVSKSILNGTSIKDNLVTTIEKTTLAPTLKLTESPYVLDVVGAIPVYGTAIQTAAQLAILANTLRLQKIQKKADDEAQAAIDKQIADIDAKTAAIKTTKNPIDFKYTTQPVNNTMPPMFAAPLRLTPYVEPTTENLTFFDRFLIAFKSF